MCFTRHLGWFTHISPPLLKSVLPKRKSILSGCGFLHTQQTQLATIIQQLKPQFIQLILTCVHPKPGWEENSSFNLAFFQSQNTQMGMVIRISTYVQLPFKNKLISKYMNLGKYTWTLPKCAKWFLKGVNSPSLRV